MNIESCRVIDIKEKIIDFSFIATFRRNIGIKMMFAQMNIAAGFYSELDFHLSLWTRALRIQQSITKNCLAVGFSTLGTKLMRLKFST